jgi:hypothetical protein
MSLRSLSLALLAAVPLLSGAQAQLQLDPASLQQLNISTGCLQGLAGLVSADPGQCLGINDALAIFGPLLQQPSSSVVAPLDSYLERDFCGKPACPESFFEQARGVLDGECAQDIPQDGALNIANAVQVSGRASVVRLQSEVRMLWQRSAHGKALGLSDCSPRRSLSLVVGRVQRLPSTEERGMHADVDRRCGARHGTARSRACICAPRGRRRVALGATVCAQLSISMLSARHAASACA